MRHMPLLPTAAAYHRHVPCHDTSWRKCARVPSLR